MEVLRCLRSEGAFRTTSKKKALGHGVWIFIVNVRHLHVVICRISKILENDVVWGQTYHQSDAAHRPGTVSEERTKRQCHGGRKGGLRYYSHERQFYFHCVGRCVNTILTVSQHFIITIVSSVASSSESLVLSAVQLLWINFPRCFGP